MKYPYFSTIDKDKRQELARKGGLKSRTRHTQRAWDEADKIKQLYKTSSYRKLAKEYNVGRNTIERIVKS